MYIEKLALSEVFSADSFQFCKKVLCESGLGEKTYFPKSLIKIPYNVSMAEAKREEEMMIFGAIDELLEKAKVKVKDIGIPVLNCTVFNPTPSFSAMVVNHHKLRTNILSYNLCGMGCSAGVISIDLAKRLLQYQVSSQCPRHILGQLVLPASEKLKFLAKFVAKELLKLKIESYSPDFKLAFNHFCFHPGGRPILDAIQKFLGLSDCEMEASKMTLYRFGNTSSSSIWYELAYLEAKGRVKKGDKIWQLAMGGGYKCNSAVWKALRNIDPKKEKNAWMDEIDEFPVSATF
ncbi:hypothetical protein L6164_016444 [Bauhinia variegata]|uniref:Uncharacterized protein n=1 Tax=Bauhinia variegata TaxID=167791 RepID=A0ACB9NPF0_BAUVA|nr:hypothetical protein L6164_016444 [Bauhinia variegata]